MILVPFADSHCQCITSVSCSGRYWKSCTLCCLATGHPASGDNGTAFYRPRMPFLMSKWGCQSTVVNEKHRRKSRVGFILSRSTVGLVMNWTLVPSSKLFDASNLSPTTLFPTVIYFVSAVYMLSRIFCASRNFKYCTFSSAKIDLLAKLWL